MMMKEKLNKPEWKDANKSLRARRLHIPCILTSVWNTLTKILKFQLAPALELRTTTQRGLW
jgi:hypothetical protein